jgi:hypothetical protein
MMLGDILAAAQDEAGRLEGWLTAEDPELARTLGLGAAQEGAKLADRVRAAVAEFSALANEEDWAHLTSRLREADDPGRTCLVEMLRWRHDTKGAKP